MIVKSKVQSLPVDVSTGVYGTMNVKVATQKIQGHQPRHRTTDSQTSSAYVKLPSKSAKVQVPKSPSHNTGEEGD